MRLFFGEAKEIILVEELAERLEEGAIEILRKYIKPLFRDFFNIYDSW